MKKVQKLLSGILVCVMAFTSIPVWAQETESVIAEETETNIIEETKETFVLETEESSMEETILQEIEDTEETVVFETEKIIVEETEVLLELETEEEIDIQSAAECENVFISGTKHYDLAIELVEEVNKKRAAQGLEPWILDGELLEECMMYAAEHMIRSDIERPNGERSVCQGFASFKPLNKDEAIEWLSRYALDPYYAKNIKSIGLGCFCYDEKYHYSLILSEASGTKTTKQGSQDYTYTIPVLKDAILWSSNVRNIYLECGESQKVSVLVGFADDCDGGQSVLGDAAAMDSKYFTWKSLDETIVTVDANGNVRGVGNGKTTIQAFYNGKCICQWNVGVGLSEEEKKECVTVTVSGIKHYEYVNQALEWVNIWRAEEGLEPMTLHPEFNERVWAQAIRYTLRSGKYPATDMNYMGFLAKFKGSCGFTNGYYTWMYQTSGSLLNPKYKSIAIACFENGGTYYWSVIPLEEKGSTIIPTEAVYVHEEVSIMKDHLAFETSPKGEVIIHVGNQEELEIYQGFWEDGKTTFDSKAKIDGTLLTWQSSDSTIASVDKNGKVTAKKKGDATIRAFQGEQMLGQWSVCVKSQVTSNNVQVIYHGPEEVPDHLILCPNDEYQKYFEVYVDGERLSEDEFYVEGFARSKGLIRYFDITFRGGYKGEYCFFINKPNNTTGLKAESAGENRVKLSWKSDSKAEGYLIYGQKNGVYGYVGMTQSTSFYDVKALDTDYNFYWVFPYVKDYDGKIHPSGCEKYVYAKGVCPAVTNLKASSVKGGVKLTWTAAAGAEGYLVYGIENGGAYGYVGMTSGTTFTAKKASKTVYNYYWIFPYHKDVNGKMITGGVAPYTYGRAR